jgi:uroporphyrinogen decarboxylase
MNSRERVLLAINHQEPDRVPLDWSGEPEVSTALQAHFGLRSHEELLRHLHVDLRHVGLQLKADPDKPAVGGLDDIWGVRHTPRTTYSGYVYHHPLAHLETQQDLDDFPWPDPAALDYESYPARLDAVGDYARVGGWSNRILWTGIEMAGLEKFMYMLFERPELIHALLRRITDYCYEVGARSYPLVRGKLDIVSHGSDFGTQQDTWMSLPMWREFVKPHFARLFALAKENGFKVYLHSDGAIRRLIPDLIEIGLDVLDPIQVRAAGMDPVGLKRDFGDRLAFHGAIDVQYTLPFGTCDEVRDEVLERLRTLGRGGGFILNNSHSLLPEFPLANVVTMYETAYESGRYPELGSAGA